MRVLPPAAGDSWPPNTFMAALTPPDRSDLLKLADRRQYADDGVLMLMGEPGDSLFVILDGFVKVIGSTEHGGELVLAIRPRGELVGEFAVLDGAPRTATVAAIATVVAARVTRDRFLAFMDDHQQAGLEIARSVVRKLRTATRRRIEIGGYDARAKIARVRYELADAYGEHTAAGVVIGFGLTQHDLGAMASVGYSTAQKILKELRGEGIIATGYRRVVVCDMNALNDARKLRENP